jgi:hypothetical protein
MPDGGFCMHLLSTPPKSTYDRIDMNPIELPPSTLAQPIPFDSDGQMRIDLLGLQPGASQLRMWKNVWNASDPSGLLYEMYECIYAACSPLTPLTASMPPSPDPNAAFPTLIAMPL